jgi:hypothetical protein
VLRTKAVLEKKANPASRVPLTVRKEVGGGKRCSFHTGHQIVVPKPGSITDVSLGTHAIRRPKRRSNLMSPSNPKKNFTRDAESLSLVGWMTSELAKWRS